MLSRYVHVTGLLSTVSHPTAHACVDCALLSQPNTPKTHVDGMMSIPRFVESAFYYSGRMPFGGSMKFAAFASHMVVSHLALFTYP